MKHLVTMVLILFLNQQAWAWGTLGHQTAAKIAWDILDSDIKEKITEILDGEDFVKSSTWADSARANQEWKFTVWYHFEKAPDNYTYLNNLKRQSDSQRKLGGLIQALFIADDTLTGHTANAVDRKNALKFMIHFIADIHQPLHTGRVEDNSGNKIPVKWLGFDLTLHQVWDSQIINLHHQDILSGSAYDAQTVIYANYLRTKFKDLPVTDALLSKYDDWMHESMVPRADAYDYVNENEYAYAARFGDIVDERVFLAGLRIANTLRKNLASPSIQPLPLEILRKSIINIVGNFVNFVSLKPRMQPIVSN